MSVINGQGYVMMKDTLREDEINKMKRELTVQPFSKNLSYALKFGGLPKKFTIYSENETKLCVPRFYGKERCGEPEVNRLIERGDRANVKFNGTLRDEQANIMKKFLPQLRETGGGILNLPCAQGKTVMALYIVSQFSLKTLVIVHKTFLLEQWISRIKQFIPDARIGVIQGSTVQCENCDIVVGMIQSLSMKTYERDTFRSFGMVIADECHHLGAEVFSKALSRISVRYMVGLTATLERKDGLENVFQWYLGKPVRIESKMKPDTDVCVSMIELEDPEYQIVRYNSKGVAMLPALINSIVESPKRNSIIIKVLKKIDTTMRKVLVLTERRHHIENLQQMLDDEGIKAGIYMGGMKRHELEASEKQRVILGTYHMISEGFDLPDLNTLIMASPKADVIQTVGRIMRQRPEDRVEKPFIVDIWDLCECLKSKGVKRKSFYKKSGFQVNCLKSTDEFEINQ